MSMSFITNSMMIIMVNKGIVPTTPPAKKVKVITKDRETQTNAKEVGTHAEPTGSRDQTVPTDQKQVTTCPGKPLEESDDALVPTVRVWLLPDCCNKRALLW